MVAIYQNLPHSLTSSFVLVAHQPSAHGPTLNCAWSHMVVTCMSKKIVHCFSIWQRHKGTHLPATWNVSNVIFSLVSTLCWKREKMSLFSNTRNSCSPCGTVCRTKCSFNLNWTSSTNTPESSYKDQIIAPCIPKFGSCSQESKPPSRTGKVSTTLRAHPLLA